jgi:hypothetical protein
MIEFNQLKGAIQYFNWETYVASNVSQPLQTTSDDFSSLELIYSSPVGTLLDKSKLTVIN